MSARVPVWQYNRKVYECTLFRYGTEPYYMGSIHECDEDDETKRYDYTVYAYNLRNGCEREIVNINDGTWHFGIPVALGNVYWQGRTFFPVINPRESYRYGINNRSVRFVSDDGIVFNVDRTTYESFIAMLDEDYDDFDVIIERFRHSRSMKSCPINKKLYLKKEGSSLVLKYKRIQIGTVQDGRTIFTTSKFVDLISEDLGDNWIIINEEETDEPDI